VQLTDKALANSTGVTGFDLTTITSLFGFANSSQSPADAKRQPQCKSYPGTPEWPSEVVWKAFDRLLDGALIKTVPLAAPCFDSWPAVKDEDTCAFIRANWGSFEFQ